MSLLSESARVNTTAEHRFRVAAPNSRPTTASLVALDPASHAVVARAVAQAPDRRKIVALPRSGETWMQDLPGQTRALIAAIERSDLMVMVATAGYEAQSASLISDACRLRGVTVTAVVISSDDTAAGALSVTLSRLRPHAGMIVVASSAAYVEDMLSALRA